MVINSQTLQQDLEELTAQQLQQVADFVAFLKFQEKRNMVLDATQLLSLAAEFAEEDRALAEAGIGDYSAMLIKEDGSD